jgi:hypothetical protein
MYWTYRRWIGLSVHALLALVLLVWSVSSSVHFWTWAFKDPIYAIGAVACIDALALTGLVLYLARIASPLVHARHALPLVSAGPLAFDMHAQFVHLGGWLTWGFTIGVTALLVALSFVVWRTIERSFVSPIEAAREYAEAQMHVLQVRATQLQAMQAVADSFVQQHLAVQPPQLVYARPAETVELMQRAGAIEEQDAVADAELVVHDAAVMQNYACIKCGASITAAPGKDPTKARAATARFGCASCRST